MAIDIENKLNKESKRDKTLEHPLIKKGWRVKKTNDIGEFPRGMDVACVYGNMVI